MYVAISAIFTTFIEYEVSYEHIYENFGLVQIDTQILHNAVSAICITTRS